MNTARPRLLMVVHNTYPVGEMRVRRQAEAAVAAGWSVDVLSLSHEGDLGQEIVDGVCVFRSRVRRTREWSMRSLILQYAGFGAAVAWHCARWSRYGVVVVANPPDFLLFCALPQRVKGARLVLDVHDLMTDLFGLRMPEHGLALAALRIVERLAFESADALLTVHHPYGEELRRRSSKPLTVEIVMNSADPRFFSPRVTRPEGVTRFLLHGSLFERNGVDDLLAAFSGIIRDGTPARLWLIGDGDAKPALRTAVAAEGLTDNVRFSDGILPPNEMAEMLSDAHVVVVPNRSDAHNRKALSGKLLEAVAVGVPVIASDLPVTRRYFSDDQVLYFRPGDVDDLREKMLFAITHSQEMEDRARKAANRYAHGLSWPQQRLTFVRFLRRCLCDSPRASS